MDWLKAHVFLASWASPCIAFILALARSKGSTAKVDMFGLVLYLISLSSLAALISGLHMFDSTDKLILLILVTTPISMQAGREASGKTVDNSH
jgi:hypothetical protein